MAHTNFIVSASRSPPGPLLILLLVANGSAQVLTFLLSGKYHSTKLGQVTKGWHCLINFLHFWMPLGSFFE